MKPRLSVEFNGIKIRCENWYWNRQMQILLAKAIDCKWGSKIKTPWNMKRKFIIVQKFPGGYFFLWATEDDFLKAPLPEWSAKALIASYPG